ncbi:phosphoribosylglycinamide formyltransferase [candidate division KSB3 bacterium]|uniref:Phosphoribosylglycinamide formyltransferase n=1 Tax=candidate division KSB3 bacterium TaxID=2044937 RepID=A0A9D5JSS2_9BACT|nr:phosphoribosylglycinamide formyltransferase [candidate division KSB3 bacterium]MBD3323583.1 phosphoribosylglycinamide formyltransferase [candidate division KSB3 bacterium]
MKKRIAIFISGRGSNMEAILKQAQAGILKDCCEVVLVFANRKDARGLQIAEHLGIQTASIASRGKQREAFDREVVEFLNPFHLDYIVLAGYMRVLSPAFIEPYRNRIINIHPADTALYQGAHAYEWAFERKLATTTITIHFVDEGVDTGRVLAQRDVDLRGADSLEEVERRGLQVEHALYSGVLRDVFTGKFE